MAIKSNAAKREAGKVSAKKKKPNDDIFSAWFEWDYDYNRIYICTSAGYCAPMTTHAAFSVIRSGLKIREPN